MKRKGTVLLCLLLGLSIAGITTLIGRIRAQEVVFAALRQEKDKLEKLNAENQRLKSVAVDPAEGVVYRVESRGVVDFLAKWVQPEKVDGCYLFECEAGKVKIPPVELPRSAFTWNRWPGKDDADSLYAAWEWAYR